jgi:hypothetical protein
MRPNVRYRAKRELGRPEAKQDSRTMTHPNSQSDRPALRSAVFVVSDRLRLLARYAWTLPLVYRVVGVLAVVYTIVAAVYDEAALWAWLSGLVVGVVGWGVTLEASRLGASDPPAVRAYRRMGQPRHVARTAAQAPAAAGGSPHRVRDWGDPDPDGCDPDFR